MTTDAYDVIVIGAGPAGESVAGRCATLGLQTAIVERELVGGECSYWGCVPSKALLRANEALAAARRVPGALQAISGEIDVPAVLARRDHLAGHWSDAAQASWLDEHDVTLVRGAGRLIDVREVDVDGRQLTAGVAVVVATGSSAAIPPVDGLRDIAVWDNRSATSAKDAPARLIVLGGGVIGVEMAQAWRHLGSDTVTVVERLGTIVPTEEPFARQEVQDALEADGITVLTETSVVSARRDGDGPVTVVLDSGDELVGDELLVAVGRRPNTADLGLEKIGLEPGHWLDVDDHLRVVGHDWLYAVGDVNGRALLTHMGKYQARIAADNICGRPSEAWADNRAVPRVVFTDPQIAAVGMTEGQAIEAGLDVAVLRHPTGAVAGASVTGEGITGTSQLVIDREREVVVGATFVGPGVSELLHSATIAVATEVPVGQLWHAVPSFPTISEVWLRLLEAYGL